MTLTRKRRNFELHPVLPVPGTVSWTGYDEIRDVIKSKIDEKAGKCVLVIDYYYDIDNAKIISEVIEKLNPDHVICSDSVLISEEKFQEKIYRPYITDDRINGVFALGHVDEYFDEAKVEATKAEIEGFDGLTVVYGVGAAVITKGDIFVYNNITIQRVKSGYFGELTNWAMDNPDEDPLTKEKTFNFVESILLDRHKRRSFEDMDFVIDGDDIEKPLMTSGEDYRQTLRTFASTPFKLDTFFNRGIWGGHWCQDVLGGGLENDNSAWGMHGWTNHQSALAKIGDNEFRVVGRDIYHYQPIEFLGNQNFFWFGYNCPIGCDFLDTWGGGNLSLQVHPDIAYSHDVFNNHFGHYESYYMMDTTEDSSVYLGTKDGVNVDELVEAFKEAQVTGEFDDEKWINRIPMKTHDHIFIPSGTIHCSGKDTVVLEINPIGYQTFKLWDWGRIDADGKPRPINIERGSQVIQEKFQTKYVMDHLVSKRSEIARGTGWRKEHSGTMELELLTVDRYWFTKSVFFETNDRVTLMILVEGDEASIESVDGSFEPMPIRYAEAVYVPASCGQFVVRPVGKPEKELAILEVFMDMGNAYE
ncbi:class I mannose-6-phosphate isomerase [Tannockella kyphosi]|uniref:class I mannose-6-phosphate isomerase n=1 Tax=Tannockella kyphosi TaxID=2899121 RepID=UPI00201318A3|nr:class I mannose-6-phosphate isomerase [Tannockella kyphosi]